MRAHSGQDNRALLSRCYKGKRPYPAVSCQTERADSGIVVTVCTQDYGIAFFCFCAACIYLVHTYLDPGFGEL